jgi:uncharacterized protein (DUF1501 family)
MQPLSPYLDRRDFLRLGGLAGVSWLTPVAHLLARAAEKAGKKEPARSVILLWMAGGPSQLETFDPHPGKAIAGGTKAIRTAVKGVQLAEGMERIAEKMPHLAIVRSVVSKEGDHERGTYTVKTGYRPDPTVIHPALGAIICRELPDARVDIPRHVSILPSQWPGRGGFFGDEYDAFKTGDPAGKVPDVTARVSPDRDRRRLEDLDVLEKDFARRRKALVAATGHAGTRARARRMMSSEQLKAFDVSHEPVAVRRKYGDTPFGRGCLAARRLIEVGVRCVEVTLDGWDTHANNHELTRRRVEVLDPAFAALIDDLKERNRLNSTVVLWAGEFGRTPKVNPLGGRDHWPTGFSVALAGGGVRGGVVVGATDPEGGTKPTNPVKVADIHATVLTTLGLDPDKVNASPIGRTVALSEGKVIRELLG